MVPKAIPRAQNVSVSGSGGTSYQLILTDLSEAGITPASGAGAVVQIVPTLATRYAAIATVVSTAANGPTSPGAPAESFTVLAAIITPAGASASGDGTSVSSASTGPAPLGNPSLTLVTLPAGLVPENETVGSDGLLDLYVEVATLAAGATVPSPVIFEWFAAPGRYGTLAFLVNLGSRSLPQ